MNEVSNFFIENTVKCWTCQIFDNLFAAISDGAAAMYQQLATFGIIIFGILFSFYVINAIWKNIQSGNPDPFFQKSIRPVVIKSLLALSLLGLGLEIPRLISTVIFEPVATVTLEFSKSMLPPNYVISTDYIPIQLSNDGFFNPQLRDTILELIQTSVTNFQGYIKLGVSVMDNSFDISTLFWIGSLIKHLIICFIGMILTYNFVRLFIKYSFCFLDIIVAMALFAFFFPLSLVFFIFKGASDLPGWMKSFGGDLGSSQIKNLVNAIVSVGATILTYTIIMGIISGYLNLNEMDSDSLANGVKSLFDFDLDNSNAMQITFAGSIVLVYVIRYIADQTKDITKKILSVFNVSTNNSLSTKAGEDILALTKSALSGAKQMAVNIINPDAAAKAAEENKNKEEKKK